MGEAVLPVSVRHQFRMGERVEADSTSTAAMAAPRAFQATLLMWPIAELPAAGTVGVHPQEP